MKKYAFAALLVLCMVVPAMAKTRIDLSNIASQGDFKSFSETFGAALSYQPLSPAEPLGDTLPGFDAGIEASYVKLDSNASWFTAIDSVGNLPDTIVIPRVHVQVGLPIVPIDLGVSYASVPDSDIKITGYELKYAILKGGVSMPAVAIRGAYTALSGIDQLDLTTKSLDLSISKGILIFTPYAGVGEVWITSEPKDGAPASLKKEDISQTKFFVGSKITFFPFLNLVVEGSFSDENIYSARLNVSF